MKKYKIEVTKEVLDKIDKFKSHYAFKDRNSAIFSMLKWFWDSQNTITILKKENKKLLEKTSGYHYMKVSELKERIDELEKHFEPVKCEEIEKILQMVNYLWEYGTNEFYHKYSRVNLVKFANTLKKCLYPDSWNECQCEELKAKLDTAIQNAEDKEDYKRRLERYYEIEKELYQRIDERGQKIQELERIIDDKNEQIEALNEAYDMEEIQKELHQRKDDRGQKIHDLEKIIADKNVYPNCETGLLELLRDCKIIYKTNNNKLKVIIGESNSEIYLSIQDMIDMKTGDKEVNKLKNENMEMEQIISNLQYGYDKLQLGNDELASQMKEMKEDFLRVLRWFE